MQGLDRYNANAFHSLPSSVESQARCDGQWRGEGGGGRSFLPSMSSVFPSQTGVSFLPMYTVVHHNYPS